MQTLFEELNIPNDVREQFKNKQSPTFLNQLLKASDINDVQLVIQKIGNKNATYYPPKRENRTPVKFKYDPKEKLYHHFKPKESPTKFQVPCEPIKPQQFETKKYTNNHYVWSVKTKVKNNNLIVKSCGFRHLTNDKFHEFKTISEMLRKIKEISQQNEKALSKYLKNNPKSSKEFYKRYYRLTFWSFDKSDINANFLLQVSNDTKHMFNNIVTYTELIEFRNAYSHLRSDFDFPDDLKGHCDKLSNLLQEYQSTIWEVCKLDPLMKNSSSGVAYKLITKYWKDCLYDVYNYPDVKFDTFARNCHTGGRSLCIKRYCNEMQTQIDFKSQYPSAMTLFPYPIGFCYKVENVEKVKNQLNHQTYQRMGLARVDLDFPEKTFYCFATIAEPSPQGKVWNLNKKYDIHLTTIEIEDAIKYNGAKVIHIHEMYEWKRKDYIFGEIVSLFKERQSNPKFSQTIKIILNSMSGDFNRRPCLNKAKVVDFEELKTMRKKLDRPDIKDLPGDKYLVYYKEQLENKHIQRPSYLYSFIVAYGKRMVNMLVDKIDGFKSLDNCPMYTDTDCVVIKKSQYEKLLQEGETFIYPRKEIPIIGGEMGQLHVEIDDIAEMYCNRPKETLAITTDCKFYPKFKGMSSIQQKKLNLLQWKELFDKLTNDIPVTVDYSGISRGDNFSIQVVESEKCINKNKYIGWTRNAQHFFKPE